MERSADAPADVLFDVLSHRQRRYVLYHLGESDVPVALADLAKEVAAWEKDETAASVSGDAYRRVYTSLYHCHVPKLVDAGIVEYDEDRNTLSLAETDGTIDDCLAVAVEFESLA